ncbi:MAG: hypothetical protein ACTSPL_02285 [Candidatus Odinarchaeia archaeon]
MDTSRWAKKMLILVLIIALIERAFNTLRFPVLQTAFDPWFHMAVTNSIIENGTLFFDAYRGTILFHIFGAFITIVTGLPLFEVVKYLPIILGALSVFPNYLMAKCLCGKDSIAVLTSLFLSCILFSYIFATDQYWPELFTFPLFALLTYLWVKSLNKSEASTVISSILIVSALVLSHDFSTVLSLTSLITAQAISLVIFRKYSAASILILIYGVFFFGMWEFFFGISSLFFTVFSLLIPLAGVFLVEFSILFLTLFLLKKEISFDQVRLTKLTYALWISFSVFSLALIFISFQYPPISYMIDPTIQYLLLAVPMWCTIVILACLGGILLLQNLNWRSGLILGINAGCISVLFVPIVLYEFGMPIIEVERVLEFLFIISGVVMGLTCWILLKNSTSNLIKSTRERIKLGFIICVIAFMIVPASIWAFPHPEGGLPYLGWNTQSENYMAQWADSYLPRQLIVSDWRVGYILRGYLLTFSPKYDVKLDARILYPENYSILLSMAETYHFNSVYLVIDDWMIEHGPTQPFSYGPTNALTMETVIFYNSNASYVKVYDNSKEFIYLIPVNGSEYH